MAIVSGDEITYERYATKRRKALCFFEYLYFASVTSEIDNRPVYEVRKRCGQQLARLETQHVNAKDWVIVPVPNTSRPIAKAYSRELGLSQIYDEGLIASGKARTFIDEGDRSAKVKRKFLPIPSVIRNKKVIVIDDSIVRSTTMATIVRYQLKEVGGAKEVHVRIATPPIIAPCYYGIDMKGFDELLAAPYQSHIEKGVMDPAVQDRFASDLGADSLVYMTHGGLISAIGADREELCMACLDRNYPTPAGVAHDRVAFERFCGSGKCISPRI
jgi:amidophosphoribosyltransferase